MRKKQVQISQIVDFISDDILKIYGSYENIFIDNIADSSLVNENSLDWINITKKDKQCIAENSNAKVIVVDPEVVYSNMMLSVDKVMIVVNQPRVVMSKIASRFFLEQKMPGIHPSAIIDKDAIIHPSVHIGPGCIIGKAKIGANCTLIANVTVHDNVVIGERCLIQAGAVIGTDGLGCFRDSTGVLSKFPHIGGVIIGNDVEIGSNTNVAKGSFGDTIIEDGCKINGLCIISHNSHLEKNVWISPGTIICGSGYIKKNATIFANVVVRDQRRIGESCVVGMGAVVTKDVPDGETWIGSPAQKMKY